MRLKNSTGGIGGIFTPPCTTTSAHFGTIGTGGFLPPLPPPLDSFESVLEEPSSSQFDLLLLRPAVAAGLPERVLVFVAWAASDTDGVF
jgi:hypothetical protein